jgi:hypothetical protein
MDLRTKAGMRVGILEDVVHTEAEGNTGHTLPVGLDHSPSF